MVEEIIYAEQKVADNGIFKTIRPKISKSAEDYTTGGAIDTALKSKQQAGDYALKSELPIVNNGTLSLIQNGETKGQFSANQANNSSIELTTPTKLSELNDDVGYIKQSDYNLFTTEYSDVYGVSTAAKDLNYACLRLHVPNLTTNKQVIGIKLKVETSPGQTATSDYKEYMYGLYDIEIYISNGAVRQYRVNVDIASTSYRPIYSVTYARSTGGNDYAIFVATASAYSPNKADCSRNIKIRLYESTIPFIENPTSDDDSSPYVTSLTGLWNTMLDKYPATSGSAAGQYGSVNLINSGYTQTGDLNYYDRISRPSGYITGCTFGYNIVALTKEGLWKPFNIGYTDSKGNLIKTKTPNTTKVINTDKFELSKGLAYYAGSGDVNTPSSITVYKQYTTFDCRYSFNSSNKTGFPYPDIDSFVYFKGTIDDEGYFTISDLHIHCDNELNALTSDDGYVYLLAGHSSRTTSTYTVEFTDVHPIVYHNGHNLVYINDPQEYVEYKYSVRKVQDFTYESSIKSIGDIGKGVKFVSSNDIEVGGIGIIKNADNSTSIVMAVRNSDGTVKTVSILSGEGE